MKNIIASLFFLLLLYPEVIWAQKAKVYEVKSPDGVIVLKVESGTKMFWSVQHKGQQLIAPSAISLTLQSGEVLGDQAKVTNSKTESVNTEFIAINYRKTVVPDIYNQLTLNCKGDFGVTFRVFNDAVAYRYFTKRKGEIVIKNEEVNFNFTENDILMIVICVYIHVKPEHVDAFIEASTHNHLEAVKEPGNLRFDLDGGVINFQGDAQAF